jgi:hypothetical protein
LMSPLAAPAPVTEGNAASISMAIPRRLHTLNSGRACRFSTSMLLARRLCPLTPEGWTPNL